MKDIDIIKSARYLGSDLVSEAMDYAPVQRRRVNPAGYIAATVAATAVFTAAVMIPNLTDSDIADSTSGEASLSNISEHSPNGDGPSVPVKTLSTSLDPDEVDKVRPYARKFFKLAESSVCTEDLSAYAEKGKVYISNSLKSSMEGQHDEDDIFMVRVLEYTGAEHNTMMEYLLNLECDQAVSPFRNNFRPTLFKYDGSFIIGLTKAQIESATCPNFLSVAFTLEPIAVWENNVTEDYLNTLYSKNRYVTVTLAGSDDPFYSAMPESYIKSVLSYYSINVDDLFAGSIDAEDLSFSGELPTSVIRALLSDSRVARVTESNKAGYEFETFHTNYWDTTRVSVEELEAIPAGTPYSNIIRRLGKTMDFATSKYYQYITDDDRLIQLFLDEPSQSCPYSGKELHDMAIPLEYDGELPEGMTYGVIGDYHTHFVAYDGEKLQSYDLNCVRDMFSEEDLTYHNVKFEDGTPASYFDVMKPGTRVLVRLSGLDEDEIKRNNEIGTVDTKIIYSCCSEIIILQ